MYLKKEVSTIKKKKSFYTALKGRKDCYILLSNVTLHILQEYWKKEKPKKWLFPSWNKGKHITARAVQKIFQNACKKAGIKKNVSAHSLRHFLATHLLESGIDLSYIQELFGHKSSKSTENYVHVSTRNLSAIKNRLIAYWKEMNCEKKQKCLSRGMYMRTLRISFLSKWLIYTNSSDMKKLNEIPPLFRRMVQQSRAVVCQGGVFRNHGFVQ